MTETTCNTCYKELNGFGCKTNASICDDYQSWHYCYNCKECADKLYNYILKHDICCLLMSLFCYFFFSNKTIHLMMLLSIIYYAVFICRHLVYFHNPPAIKIPAAEIEEEITLSSKED